MITAHRRAEGTSTNDTKLESAGGTLPRVPHDAHPMAGCKTSCQKNEDRLIFRSE